MHAVKGAARLRNLRGGMIDTPLLDSQVVRRADAGKQRQLLAT
jgi:hypothetical protein